MTSEPSAWLVRGSRNGARDLWMLASGKTGIDFPELPDLSGVPDLPTMRAFVAKHIAGLKPGAISNYAAQLYAFAKRISIGDTVVLPLKNTGKVAIGIVTGGYEFAGEQAELSHVRPVDWKVTGLPRTAIHQDLLYSLGAFSTVVQVKRNDAAYRLRKLLDGATQDPGSRSGVATPIDTDPEVPDSDEVLPDEGFDILLYSNDRVRGRITERFAGHRLADLVAGLLRAEGLTCKVSHPGADGGVDIVAGSGVLGISAPTIVVQVKSEPTPVGSQVVDQLGGVVSLHSADHGLLVAMGGLTKPAQDKVDAQRLKFAVWDADEVVRRLYLHYEVLPDDVRAEVPLKRAWVIDESAAS